MAELAQSTGSEVLRVREAARVLGVSPDTIKRWIYQGKIKSIKTPGGHHRIPTVEIDRLLHARKTGIRILVTEDNDESRDLIVYMLEQCGYEVASARTGAESWALAMTQHFDLHVVDNRLPDILGTELCQRIRERNALVPIIMLSGLVDENEMAKAREINVPYLVKPVEFYRLVAAVRERLET